MQKKYCGSMIVKRIEENRPPEWIFCYPNTERSGFARNGFRKGIAGQSALQGMALQSISRYISDVLPGTQLFLL